MKGKKGNWTKEEDEALLELKKIYGNNYADICRALK